MSEPYSETESFPMNPIASFYNWLHGQWPAGTTELLPEVGEDGVTNVDGIRIAGDLSGIPLLKFSSDTGAKAVKAILGEDGFEKGQSSDDGVVDLAIIGGGIAGFSAAIEAKRAGLSYVLFESAKPFSTIANFPKKKPIYTYPTDMKPAGGITYEGDVDVKETLLEDVKRQTEEAGIETTIATVAKVQKKGDLIHIDTDAEEAPKKARRCIVAIGRSGNYRTMDIPGEDLDLVSNRLIDAAKFKDQKVMVVGGGDSAAEYAVALADEGAEVTLSYRKDELTRPKPENVKAVQDRSDSGKIDLKLGTQPKQITENSVTLETKDGEEEIETEAVIAALGREAPLDFFRKSGLNVANDKTPKWWITLVIAALLGTWLYHWKKGPDKLVNGWLDLKSEGLLSWLPDLGEGHIVSVIKASSEDRAFYYSLAYCLCVLIFGIRRVRRRKTPYVKRQTLFLNVFQWVPLFILPFVVLPWMGANGWFDSGIGQWFAETFFSNGKGEGADNYWRAFGFVLAWPLFVFNLFTEAPLWGWLVVSLIQTFVIIPLIVRRWGKGAYCGWICSCGALAETMGDAHRHKMPHGPFWNKLNMIGQVFLWAAFLLLGFRILGWIFPESFWNAVFQYLTFGSPLADKGLPIFNYAYFVDLIWAGIMGVSFYFHLSGRVWCRFACPLAALMHLYQKGFGRFRIFSEKEKCISCNVCTSVCHQGIDVMSFANKGKPMEDPECVRCSACVQQCPTGVLSFGRYTDTKKSDFLLDKLPASPVKIKEQDQV